MSSRSNRALQLLGVYFEEHLRALEEAVQDFDKVPHNLIGDQLFIVLAKARAVVNSAGYLREGAQKEATNGDSCLSVSQQCGSAGAVQGPQRIEDLQYVESEAR